MLASKVYLQEFLGKYGANSDVNKLLDGALLKAKSGAITIHPYGFYILKPIVDINKQVRIHIWLRDHRKKQDPDWPPHNHNYNIDSLLLKGELRHNFWSVREENTGGHILYAVEYDSQKSKLNKTDRVCTCDIKFSDSYQAGGRYHLKKFDYHSVDVGLECEAVTLCVMTEPENATQHVVGDMQGEDSYEFIRKNVSPKEAKSVIDVLMRIRDGLQNV